MTVFPSVARLENDLVARVAAHLGAPGCQGTFTSGGTESILLAVKTARDHARATRGVRAGELVLPATAHAAFHKAAHYLGLTPVTVPVDPETYRADPAATARALTPDTVLVVAPPPATPTASSTRSPRSPPSPPRRASSATSTPASAAGSCPSCAGPAARSPTSA